MFPDTEPSKLRICWQSLAKMINISSVREDVEEEIRFGRKLSERAWGKNNGELEWCLDDI